MTIFNVITLFGGLALFLYGMRLMGDGLKHSSAGALKKTMEKVTNNPFMGFMLGLLVTGVIQSSTATIVLTAGLVGAGIITLRQSLGIVLGANVGTTVTGQIIRLLDVNASAASWLNFFKPDTLAPLAAILGILLIMVFHFRNSDTLGDIAMGFGILFTGLLSMTAAVTPLSESESFANLFINFSKTPILGFLVGTAAAFTIQSSSATIGILQALSTTGALTFGSVYAIIIGVNIGDCVTTAIVCAIGSKADAKRTGVVHVIFNLFALVLVVMGVTVFHRLGWLDKIWDATITSGGIANAHTLFRLISAVVLLPLVSTFEKMSRKLVKDDKILGESVDEELARLDEKLFSSPGLALEGVSGAISTMARLANTGVLRAVNGLEEYDRQAAEEIRENEDRLDTLADKVDLYLLHLAPHTPEGELYDKLNYYTQCFSELERIGDHAVNLTEIAAELRENRVEFSPVAKAELAIVRDAVVEILSCACRAVTELDMEAARRIEPLEEVVDDMVATLRKNHIRRLHGGVCTTVGGLNFLDALSNLERVSDQCSNIGLFTLGLQDQQVMQSHHDYTRYLHSGQDAFFNEAYAANRKHYFGRLNALETE